MVPAREQSSNTYKSLELHDWRQYGDVRLEFHPQLTVLTGANASGKTTILHLLNQPLGWGMHFIGTPARKRRGGALSFLSGLRRRIVGEEPAEQAEIGSLSYADGVRSPLTVPREVGGAAFNVTYGAPPGQAVAGLFVPSHRPMSVYRPVGQIPTTLQSREQILETYLAELRSYYQGGSTTYGAPYRLKEALISLAMFGPGNRAVEPNPEAEELFEGFQNALRRVLPDSLGFRQLAIRMPEVVLETSTVDFAFDAVSGGLASIIDLT